MPRNEVTGKAAASKAGRTLSKPGATNAAKTAAASALTQRAPRTAPPEVTSKAAASKASRVLSNPNSTRAARSAAASALTQRPGRSTSKRR